jgi:hypothetical protein
MVFPAWLAGTWECASRLAEVTTPLGSRLAPRSVLRQPIGEESMAFAARWLPSADGLSTLADVAFNFRSLSEAQLRHPGAVLEVRYDGERDPSRLHASFAAGEADLFLSATRADDVNAEPFYCAECSRFVTSGDASDSQTLSRFERGPGHSVKLSQRVAFYWTALDPLYFEAVSKSVAVLRYETLLSRLTDGDGGGA